MDTRRYARAAVLLAIPVVAALALGGGQPAKQPAATSQPTAASRPAMLESQVTSWAAASSHKDDWGEMRTYFRGETRGTKDAFVAVAVVEPGKAVHRTHRHAEEEYLVINEGAGMWQLGEKTFPANKSDILSVEPWVFHGLVNTGDKPLVFTVVRFNCKGVPPPPRPDAGPDEP